MQNDGHPVVYGNLCFKSMTFVCVIIDLTLPVVSIKKCSHTIRVAEAIGIIRVIALKISEFYINPHHFSRIYGSEDNWP